MLFKTANVLINKFRVISYMYRLKCMLYLCICVEAGWASNPRFANIIHSTPLDADAKARKVTEIVGRAASDDDRFETVWVRSKIHMILSQNPTITRTHLRSWAKLVNAILLRYARHRKIHLPIKIDSYQKERITFRNILKNDICVKYVCTEDCVIPIDRLVSTHTPMHSFATPLDTSSDHTQREKCIMQNCKGLLFQFLGVRGKKPNFRPREVVVSLSILSLLENVYADAAFRANLWTETDTLDMSDAGITYDITDSRQWSVLSFVRPAVRLFAAFAF